MSTKKRNRSAPPANGSKKQRTSPSDGDSVATSSTTSTAIEDQLTVSFANKLYHGKHERIWFRLIFEYLDPNQAERIELRTFSKYFRDLLPPPSQIWTQFPHSKHATWASLVAAVNVAWRKNAEKAPTLIVVRRGIVHHNNDEMIPDWVFEDKKEEGEYVPFYKVSWRDWRTGILERSFRRRNYDCSANGFVREIAGEGENDEIVLTSLKSVAKMLSKEKRYSTSENLERRILKVNERMLGVNHPDTLTAVNNLGNSLYPQGKLEEAETLSRRALEGRERVLGVDHPGTLSSASILGRLLQKQGKLEEAEVLLRRVLEGRERVLGVDHPNTLSSVSKLGYLLRAQGKLEEAVVLYRRGIEGRERVLGVNHLKTLGMVSILGRLLQKQGKLEEAETLFRRALEGYERVLGVDHPDTLLAVNNLGTLFQAQDKLDEAETLFRRALKRNERVLGVHHPDTLRSRRFLDHLEDVYQELDEAEWCEVSTTALPKRCSACDAPKTFTHKLRDCKCKAVQYCNAKCQAAHWESHQEEHRRLYTRL